MCRAAGSRRGRVKSPLRCEDTPTRVNFTRRLSRATHAPCGRKPPGAGEVSASMRGYADSRQLYPTPGSSNVLELGLTPHRALNNRGDGGRRKLEEPLGVSSPSATKLLPPPSPGLGIARLIHSVLEILAACARGQLSRHTCRAGGSRRGRVKSPLRCEDTPTRVNFTRP